ncbi:MAG: Gfo/Idh/MocA family oxidoreductase [Chloroflexi bacterium]|nr:Gfo/Idh/MocA family oxidoreductase [Chloroflexota bacterium]
MATTFRAAIIGTGRIGSTYDDQIIDKKDPAFFQGEMRNDGLYTVHPINHAGSYQTTPGYELVAAANRGAEKLRTFGERWGVKATYTDYYKLLRDEKPDVVSITTQSPEKAEATIAAAEAGVKAIVVEKAMATSMAEADAMIAACERNGVFLAVDHPCRFSPLHRRARQLIESGAIGKLGIVTAYSVSGMLHVGTHTFDLMRFWGGDVTEIEARVPDYEPEKDIAASGMLWYKNGAIGLFDHVQRVVDGFEARGSEGYLTSSNHVGDGWLYKISPFFQAGSKWKHPNQLTVEPIIPEPHTMSTLQRLLTELYQTLTTGAPFISTGQDGAAALELGLACYASHLAGGPVKLPLADRSLRVPNR